MKALLTITLPTGEQIEREGTLTPAGGFVWEGDALTIPAGLTATLSMPPGTAFTPSGPREIRLKGVIV